MFSLILPGRPCLPPPPPLPNSPNQFAFSFPSHPHFSHIVVFLVPGQILPPDTAAGVYLQLPGQENQGFKFLGALGWGKESAIFRVNLPASSGGGGGGGGSTVGGEGAGGDMGDTMVNLGISVEPASSIHAQMMQLEAEKQSQTQNQNQAGMGVGNRPSTKILAQRIIQNAFHFLAGFSGRVGEGGVEVVPLKSFEEWWRKFERRVELDPGFLERGNGE